jgi:hypothetical protein
MTGSDMSEDQATRQPPARRTSGGDPAAARKERFAGSRERFAASRAGDVWSRLSAVDFFNQALILAGMFMCACSHS